MWSPTQTERWLQCPVKWALARAGTEERRERAWSPALILGRAIHAGFARVMLGENGAREVFIEALIAQWPVDSSEWDRDMVIERGMKALMKLAGYREELLQDMGTVVDVETPLGPEPRPGEYPGTPDLVTRHGPASDSYLVVTDLKTHWTLDNLYVQKDQEDTRHSWQLHQYAYFTQKKYELPVRAIRKVTLRVTPYPKVWIYSWWIEPRSNRLEAWYTDAQRVWSLMGTVEPWHNLTQCRNQYGRCGYYNVCH